MILTPRIVKKVLRRGGEETQEERRHNRFVPMLNKFV